MFDRKYFSYYLKILNGNPASGATSKNASNDTNRSNLYTFVIFLKKS